jgi:hypothetical protein
VFLGVIGVEANQPPPVVFPEDLQECFERGLAHGLELANRVVVSTPEARLDALASVSVAAIDGTWYPPYFVHSAMLWNIPFPGWRTMFGGTMYGWHDRLRETAKYFIKSQVVDSDKTQAEPDPDRLLAIQGQGSRFYGKGRITVHSGFYDMQSQFFDQLITEWRWNPVPEFEQLLKPALDLHLEWLQECFDPDKDGAYESYINSWPTDSVWYNGGGSCEATSYAYRGHQAALEMAHRAGNKEKEAFHQTIVDRIREGFFKQLWIARCGHPGKYREQGGHKRLHEDPWLYGIFLPIDAGLLSREQAATALNYANTSLQNDQKSDGGRMVWNSNWVPGIWSTRTDWPGDNYALALANFQVGLAQDGWEIFKGTFFTTAYNGSCPGNLGHKAGGYDFGDCAHTLARTLVEGLFGFCPDYPNSVVRLRPQFPAEWLVASIRIPDASLSYKEQADIIDYEIDLASPSCLEIRIPVRAKKIVTVKADGQPVPYYLLSGFDTGIVCIDLTSRTKTHISIETADRFAPLSPVCFTCERHQQITIALEEGSIDNLKDPQGIFACSEISQGRFAGKVTGPPGSYRLLAEMFLGEVPIFRVIHLTVNDTKGDATRSSQAISKAPSSAEWRTIDFDSLKNCDVRDIFRQKYFSPRPNTVSLRIGTDGWTPWTSTFWGQSPPDILLEKIPALINSDGLLVTPQGVKLEVPREGTNIAFTSLWDNFPSSIEVPVNAKAEALWLLVAGSTNPMQCQIANATIRLKYSNGDVHKLDLIPPQNFWALAPIKISGSELGQSGRFDYTDPADSFCVRKPHPQVVQLGTNCRAMLYGLRLNALTLESVTLETLSQEVVIGLMAASLMNPEMTS